MDALPLMTPLHALWAQPDMRRFLWDIIIGQSVK